MEGFYEILVLSSGCRWVIPYGFPTLVNHSILMEFLDNLLITFNNLEKFPW